MKPTQAAICDKSFEMGKGLHRKHCIFVKFQFLGEVFAFTLKTIRNAR